MVEVESVQTVEVRRAGRREWIGLAALVVPMMFILLDNGIIFLALPQLTENLGASSTQILWIADIYGFFLMAFLVAMGRIADRIGHRRLLLIGAAAFSVLSLMAAFTTSPVMLIVLRAALGIAGGTVGPSVFAIIRQLFPDRRQMATAMSIFATSAMIGVALGPTVGGVLLHWFWPGSVFLIAVPVMLWLLVVGPIALPETRQRSTAPVDLSSVVLWLSAVLPTIYGVTTLARVGWAAAPVVAIVVGLALGTAFVTRERRLPNPLLDMRLFGIRAIGTTLAMFLLVGIVQSGNGLVLNQHLQLVEGYSTLATALWMVLPISVAIGGVHLSTMLAKRTRPAFVIGGGLVVASVGSAVLSQIDAVGGLTTLLVGLCIVMAGTSPVGVLSGQLVMQSAPAEQAGSAGSLNGTAGELSSALGIAVFGSLVNVFYSGNVRTPDALSPAAETHANDSISHAVAIARDLPTGPAEALVSAARDTFNNAVTNIAALCVVLFLALAVLTVATLREIPPIGAKPSPAKRAE
ncbi:MFS transporter [Rhizomonospora bruguierae]|uniref:MFS transporter n=1 Tax=Rhizomonospora bruguierae TaxID=1581705 RepID=UPI001BCF179D|nr:MFS transporter [Micromonospora sp. NBRC 107566]